TVAEGVDKRDGKPGEVKYFFDTTTDIDRTSTEDEEFDFRNVMRIPTVDKKEKLATIIAPTKGEAGKTVYGTPIKARQGRPVILRPGKNVSFNDITQSFQADVQ